MTPGVGASSSQLGTPTAIPALLGRRVLVVDDVDAVARSTARILELFGAIPTVARSGADALARLTTPWDLLVLDVGLGDLDGREVLRRARVLHPRLPVVLASGLPLGGAVLEPGVSFLPKPFALAKLLSVVEAALASGACAPAACTPAACRGARAPMPEA